MQRDMLRTANELLKRGHQVEVFTLSWQGDAPQNMAMHVLPQKGLFNYQRYKKFIKASFDIIESSDFDFIFGYNRMAGLDAHFAADPCFIERAHKLRNALYRLTPRYKWFAACEKAIFSANASTEVLAVSLTEKPHFEKWYGFQTTRFHYIPPFLSTERLKLFNQSSMRKHLRQAFSFDADDFVFLLTGSGFAMKGLDRAILALAALPDNFRKKTRLVAVGQDNPKPFEAMAKKHGVETQVVISKGRDDIPKLMQGADVCVHPAYRENTGLVILEGMASNTPMLITESCGYASHVQAAEAGLVSPSPFNQSQFNAQWLSMRQALDVSSADRPAWAENGLAYAKKLMKENDGSAEALILIELAQRKLNLAT